MKNKFIFALTLIVVLSVSLSVIVSADSTYDSKLGTITYYKLAVDGCEVHGDAYDGDFYVKVTFPENAFYGLEARDFLYQLVLIETDDVTGWGDPLYIEQDAIYEYEDTYNSISLYAYNYSSSIYGDYYDVTLCFEMDGNINLWQLEEDAYSRGYSKGTTDPVDALPVQSFLDSLFSIEVLPGFSIATLAIIVFSISVIGLVLKLSGGK